MKKTASGADRKAFSLKERFNYWFDNRMARGSLGLIRSLVAASILLAVVVAALIVLFRLNGESDAASVFWDSIATIINAWMPSYEDGEIGYLILMALVAIAGVLFTSVLIGIITSTIEEKIIDLRKGNSRVLESDHIVVLGFYPGEYTLLRQLVLAAAEESVCIVVVEEMEREELEQAIRDNVDAPKNVRIVCRTADITDPADLEKCSVETCRTVIVSPTDDVRTVKTLLAVAALAQEKGVRVRTSAILSRNEHRLPPSIAEANGITALQTNDTLAKMIAHSCTQTGLSETFREVFNFDGNEFFLSDVPGICGLTFGEAALRLDRAVPVGIYRSGRAAPRVLRGKRHRGPDRGEAGQPGRRRAVPPAGGRADGHRHHRIQRDPADHSAGAARKRASGLAGGRSRTGRGAGAPRGRRAGTRFPAPALCAGSEDGGRAAGDRKAGGAYRGAQ